MQYGDLTEAQIVELNSIQAYSIREPSFVVWIEGFGDPTRYVMEIDSEVALEFPLGRGRLNIGRAILVMSNEDGVTTELPWWAVKKRASELGVKCVCEVEPASFINEESDREGLVSLAGLLAEGPSLFGDHIREGIAIRVEHQEWFGILKSKSFIFGLLEGYLKEDESVVDREEAA